MNSKFSSVPVRSNRRRPASVNRNELCGIGGCTPHWMQRFADPKVYLLIYCTLGILQGAYFTYFIGVISTLEKRYAFESKITGIIMIADNLSPIFTSTLIGYFGGKAHKPRLIAGGMSLVILSCLLSTLPYFIYGPALHLLTETAHVKTKRELEFCDSEMKPENCDKTVTNSTVPAIAILFIANFLNGFGYTAFYTIGAPYLDDNVKKKNSPAYFSAMSALRIFGPALGFLLSSFCLRYYEDPFYDPGISQLNPRWVGAWWMGFLILAASLFVFTIPLILFPRELPERFRSEVTETKKKVKEAEAPPKLKDYPREIRRLLKNPILVCHIISITLQINGFAGYFVFMPKYMESQYHQSASSASLFSGATGILPVLLGVLIGGLLIKKYRPRPRYLTGYMVYVEMFSIVGLLISIFLGCSPVHMPGTTLQDDETLNLYNECNVGCHCSRRVFEPVCSEDGTATFFSPCFAGCTNSSAYAQSVLSTAANGVFNSTSLLGSALLNDSLKAIASSSAKRYKEDKIFKDCQCLITGNSTFTSGDVKSGFCPLDCNMFLPYIIMLTISKFISSTARVGNTLITFRCVDAKDKSFALGTFGSVLAAFAFIPYPLIFGALTDSACLVWEESCSKTGNCWHYDSDKFRYYLHGMSILLIALGICFDAVVFMLSDRLTNFYGEDDEPEPQRIAQWIKEEEEEDVVFLKCPKKTSMTNVLHTS